MGTLEELLKGHKDTLDLHYKAIMFLLYKYQQEQASKVPRVWNPYTIFLTNSDTTELLPRNDKRDGFSIVNIGPSPLIIAPEYFYPSSAVALFYGANPTIPVSNVNPNNTGMINYLLIEAGESATSINSTGPLFAYAVNESSTSPTVNYSEIHIVETAYASTLAGDSRRMAINGEAGKLLHGITERQQNEPTNPETHLPRTALL